jgi:hypothetical protein
MSAAVSSRRAPSPEPQVPILAGRDTMIEPSLPLIVLLYADFPGQVGRWERNPRGTAARLFRAHDCFCAAVAAHGGEPVPAPLDARCARFAGPAAALAAARAFRRASEGEGGLPVRLALAGGPGWPDGVIPMPLLHRVRLLAEGAAAGQVLLDEPAAAALAGGLPEGTHPEPQPRRRLPGLARPARVVFLRESDRVGAAPASSPTDRLLDTVDRLLRTCRRR